MGNISARAKNELDKLVNIAIEYRDSTISESFFYDVIYSIPDYDKHINEYIDYLEEKGVWFLTNDNVEDTHDIDNEDTYVKPYNTTKIDISPKPLTLDLILERLDNDEIDLIPDFQRKSGLWGGTQKSQLIESLILRIPLPAFYFDGSNNDRWIVIDGLQRLTALKEFFIEKDTKKKLRLTGLEFLQDLEGLSVEDMPRAYLRRMKETQITSYIINPGAPVNLKYNIFKRINTGGLELEPQEIRHALYQGFATQYIKDLADLQIFKKATGYSINTSRMLDREFVLRFVSFFEFGPGKYQGSIEKFLNSGMELINNTYDEKRAKHVMTLFESSLRTSLSIFGKFAFRRMPDMEKRRPISKALFETWTSILAHYTARQHKRLIEHKENLVEKYMVMNSKDIEFINSVRSGKTAATRRRFDMIDLLVKEFAE